MRKKAFAIKRPLEPDPKYKSKLVSKFINMIMYDGKKSIAETILYGALDIISQKSGGKPPLEIFNKAVENVKPLLEVKSRRIGGATYQVPIEVKEERSITLALRWIKDFARAKKGKPMNERLAEEIMAAHNGEGASIKRKEDMHRMAKANKAFSHYRW